MSFPKSEQRKKCWNCRDLFWKCLDENDDNLEKCTNYRKGFEEFCSKQWVQYFDRRRAFLKFKDKIEQGYDPAKEQAK